MLYEGVMRLDFWWRLGVLIMISQSWHTQSRRDAVKPPFAGDSDGVAAGLRDLA